MPLDLSSKSRIEEILLDLTLPAVGNTKPSGCVWCRLNASDMEVRSHQRYGCKMDIINKIDSENNALMRKYDGLRILIDQKHVTAIQSLYDHFNRL